MKSGSHKEIKVIMEDRYVYILNLTRYRIFLLGIGFVVLFIFVFVLGLGLGIQSDKFAKAPVSVGGEIKSLIDNGEIHTETFNTLDGESPHLISREGQLQPTTVSSADLLAQDNDASILKKNDLQQNKVSKKKNYRIDNLSSKVLKSSSPQKPHREKTRIAPTGYKPKYFIQLLVSSDKSRAGRIVQKLLKDKFKGYIRSNKVNGKNYYAVRVGLYTDKKEANQDLKTLKAKGVFKDAYIKVNIPNRS